MSKNVPDDINKKKYIFYYVYKIFTCLWKPTRIVREILQIRLNTKRESIQLTSATDPLSNRNQFSYSQKNFLSQFEWIIIYFRTTAHAHTQAYVIDQFYYKLILSTYSFAEQPKNEIKLWYLCFTDFNFENRFDFCRVF